VYPIEVEPHVTFGAENVFGATGFGAGLMASIPVVFGLFKRVLGNLAITFGDNLLHHDNCYYSDHCGANYLMLPAAEQGNMFLACRISFCAEADIFVFKRFFDGCGSSDGPGCSPSPDFGILPTSAVGGRLCSGDNVYRRAKRTTAALRTAPHLSTVGPASQCRT